MRETVIDLGSTSNGRMFCPNYFSIHLNPGIQDVSHRLTL